MATIASVCQEWTEKFRGVDIKFRTDGIPSPEETAKRIIAHALGKEKISEVSGDLIVSEEMRGKIETLCKERLDSTPLQYILGKWDFNGITLVVRPPVFIPRAETEKLVDLIMDDLIREGRDKQPMKFIDMCCGGGAISLYLLKQLPLATCIAIDKLPEACELTLENAKLLWISDRIKVLQGDILEENLLNELCSCGQVDMVVCNPPYCPSSLLEIKPEPFFRLESLVAYNGGEDGFDVTKRVLSISKQLLKSKGCLWFETFMDFPPKMRDIVSAKPELGLEFVKEFDYNIYVTKYCKLRRK